MGSDDKLGTALRASVDLHEQRELPLGRQSRFRLVKKVDPVFPEGVLSQCKKAFPVGFLMIVLRNASGTFAVFIFHSGDIVEALRPEKIPIARFAGTAGKPDCTAQL